MLRYFTFLFAFVSIQLFSQHHPKLWGTGYGGKNFKGEIFNYDIDSNKQHNIYDFEYTPNYVPGAFEYPLAADSTGRLFGHTPSQIFILDTINKVKTVLVVDTSFGILSGPMVYYKGYFYGLVNYSGKKSYTSIFEYDPYNNLIKKKKTLTNYPSYYSSTGLILKDNRFYFSLLRNSNEPFIASYDITSGKLDTVFAFYTTGIKYKPTGKFVIVDSILYGTLSQYFSANGAVYQLNLNSKVFTVLANIDPSFLIDDNNMGDMNLYGKNIYFTLQKLSSSDPYGGIVSLNTVNKKIAVNYRFVNLKAKLPSNTMLLKDSFFYFYFNQILPGNLTRAAIYRFYPGSGKITKDFSDTMIRINIQERLILLNERLFGICNGISNYGSDNVIFELTKDTAHLSVFHEFSQAPNGAGPEGRLISVGNNIIGVCTKGGASNGGTLYAFDAKTKKIKVLYDFINIGGGINPNSNLINFNNVIYGSTKYGGTGNKGTLFKYDLLSAKYTKLHDFTFSATSNNLLLTDSILVIINNRTYLFNLNQNKISDFNSQSYQYAIFENNFYYFEFLNPGSFIQEDMQHIKKRIQFQYPKYYAYSSNFVRMNGSLYSYLYNNNKDSFMLFEFNLGNKEIKVSLPFRDTLLQFANLYGLISFNKKIVGFTKDGTIPFNSYPNSLQRNLLEMDPFKHTSKRLNAVFDLDNYNYLNPNNTSTPCGAFDSNVQPVLLFGNTYINTCSNPTDTVTLNLSDADNDSLMFDLTTSTGDSLNVLKVNDQKYEIIFNKNAKDTTIVYAFYADGFGEPLTQKVNIIAKRIHEKLTAGKTQICADDSVKFSLSGNYHYLWNDGDTSGIRVLHPKTSQNYTVKVSNEDCKDSLNASVTVLPLPTVSFSFNIDTICKNHDQFSMKDNSKFSPANGVFYLNNTVINTYIFLDNTAPGLNYVSYKYTNANNCTSIAYDSFYLDTCDALGVDKINNELARFRVFPNPSHGEMIIQASEPFNKVEILSMDGKAVQTFEVKNEKIVTLDTRLYSRGIYLVRVTDIHQNIYFEKVQLD